MKFSGRLQIEADPRNWLKTDLNLNQGRLELVSGDDILGSWSTAQVKAERVEGNRFQLHLGDDRAVFAADDALAFSYEALPVLAKKTVLATASTLRGKLRKGLAGTERPPMADARDVAEATPIPASEIPADAILSDPDEVPQPTRKLRDLIQAAVRANTDGSAPSEGNHRPRPEGNDRKSPELTLREVNLAPSATVAHPPPQRGPSAPAARSEPDEARPGVDSGSARVVEPVSEDPLFKDLPAFGDDRGQEVRPAFDLTPDFIEPAAANPTIERGRTLRALLDGETNGFDDGDTLGERPAEAFGWVRASEEAKPAVMVEPPPPLLRSLDTLIQEVRNGGMSPAQIGAITDLIRAVADTVENKNRR